MYSMLSTVHIVINAQYCELFFFIKNSNFIPFILGYLHFRKKTKQFCACLSWQILTENYMTNSQKTSITVTAPYPNSNDGVNQQTVVVLASTKFLNNAFVTIPGLSKHFYRRHKQQRAPHQID